MLLGLFLVTFVTPVSIRKVFHCKFASNSNHWNTFRQRDEKRGRNWIQAIFKPRSRGSIILSSTTADKAFIQASFLARKPILFVSYLMEDLLIQLLTTYNSRIYGKFHPRSEKDFTKLWRCADKFSNDNRQHVWISNIVLYCSISLRVTLDFGTPYLMLWSFFPLYNMLSTHARVAR